MRYRCFGLSYRKTEIINLIIFIIFFNNQIWNPQSESIPEMMNCMNIKNIYMNLEVEIPRRNVLSL